MEHVKNDLSKAKWQKDIAETVAKKCLAEAKEPAKDAKTDEATNKKDAAPISDKKETSTVASDKKEIAAVDKKEEASAPKCNGASLKFAHCVWREFTKSCPADKQSDSKKCSALREKLAKGEDIDYSTLSGHHHHKSHHRSSGRRDD